MVFGAATLKGVIKLGPGSAVEVYGLEKQPELNGQVGSCIAFNPAKGRWGVELAGGKQVSLKISNIRPVDDKMSPAAPEGTDGRPVPAGDAPCVRIAPAGNDTAAAVGQANPGTERPASADAKECAPPAACTAASEACCPSAPAPCSGQVPDETTKREEGSGACETSPVQASGDADPPSALAPWELAPKEPPAAQGEGAAYDSDFPALQADPDAEAPFEMPPQPPRPKTGRWWEEEHAAVGFAEQLRDNEPELVTLCLVPPKKFDPEDVEAICDGLERNTCCTELFASGHPLSEASCERIAAMLRKNSTLNLLSVGESSLGDTSLALFAGLGENTTLTSLDLEHKGLTTRAGEALADALAARCAAGAPRLSYLRLCRNVGMAGALHALASVPAPRHLMLCEAGLQADLHGALLGRWVATGIEELNLRGNPEFGGDGLELMLSALMAATKQPPLVRLSVDGCAIGDDGVEVVCDALKNGLGLRELSVENCELTEAAAELLASGIAGIRGCGRLARLSVRLNKIGDDGVERLAGCAERIDVSGTDLGPRGFQALGQEPLTSAEIFNNPRLGMSVDEWLSSLTPDSWAKVTQLDMSCCALGDEGFKRFCTLLTERTDIFPVLQSLCLGGNDVDEGEEKGNHEIDDKLIEARGGNLRLLWRNG